MNEDKEIDEAIRTLKSLGVTLSTVSKMANVGLEKCLELEKIAKALGLWERASTDYILFEIEDLKRRCGMIYRLPPELPPIMLDRFQSPHSARITGQGLSHSKGGRNEARALEQGLKPIPNFTGVETPILVVE